jgi:hypothetical protein
MIVIVHGMSDGLTTQNDPKMNALLFSRPVITAVPGTGAAFAGKNRFIRLVLLLLRADRFANLLGREKQNNIGNLSKHD